MPPLEPHKDRPTHARAFALTSKTRRSIHEQHRQAGRLLDHLNAIGKIMDCDPHDLLDAIEREPNGK